MTTVLTRLLVWTVVTLIASIACAQDNIHQRPPLNAIGRVEGGTGYLLAITGGTGPLASARAIHAVALVYWLEVRRRQESIIAMRRLERLLTEEERKRLPNWSVTQ